MPSTLPIAHAAADEEPSLRGRDGQPARSRQFKSGLLIRMDSVKDEKESAKAKSPHEAHRRQEKRIYIGLPVANARVTSSDYILRSSNSTTISTSSS